MNPYDIPITPAEFRAILLSHGWFDLTPFEADIAGLRLVLPFVHPDGAGAVEIYAAGESCQVSIAAGEPGLAQKVVENALSLGRDMTAMYDALKGTEWAWLPSKRLGRYLRGATLFEDCWKIMLTTNTHWSRTKAMVSKTVESFGIQVGGRKAFPLPAAFVGVTAARLGREIGCGYRAKFLEGLYQAALGDPGFFTGTAWQDMPAKTFTAKLQGIPGLGPMCVSYLCRFYGKPGAPTIDSWVLGRCHEVWGVKPERKAVERFVKRRYGKLGDYAATVFWFEITRFWHEKKGGEGAWWKGEG